MSTKLHSKSKRYEVQKYEEKSLTWVPVSHTDNHLMALQNVHTINVAGEKARVRDRKCGLIVITANQLCSTKTQT